MEWFEQEWRGGKEENHEYILEKLSNKCARGGKKKKEKRLQPFQSIQKKKNLQPHKYTYMHTKMVLRCA